MTLDVKLSEHLRFLGHETHSNSSFSSSFVLFLKSWSAPPLQTRLRLPRPSCHAHASDCLASTGRFLDFLLLSKNAFCLKMVEKFCSLWRNFCLEQIAQRKNVWILNGPNRILAKFLFLQRCAISWWGFLSRMFAYCICHYAKLKKFLVIWSFWS